MGALPRRAAPSCHSENSLPRLWRRTELASSASFNYRQFDELAYRCLLFRAFPARSVRVIWNDPSIACATPSVPRTSVVDATKFPEPTLPTRTDVRTGVHARVPPGRPAGRRFPHSFVPSSLNDYGLRSSPSRLIAFNDAAMACVALRPCSRDLPDFVFDDRENRARLRLRALLRWPHSMPAIRLLRMSLITLMISDFQRPSPRDLIFLAWPAPLLESLLPSERVGTARLPCSCGAHCASVPLLALASRCCTCFHGTRQFLRRRSRFLISCLVALRPPAFRPRHENIVRASRHFLAALRTRSRTLVKLSIL